MATHPETRNRCRLGAIPNDKDIFNKLHDLWQGKYRWVPINPKCIHQNSLCWKNHVSFLCFTSRWIRNSLIRGFSLGLPFSNQAEGTNSYTQAFVASVFICWTVVLKFLLPPVSSKLPFVLHETTLSRRTVHSQAKATFWPSHHTQAVDQTQQISAILDQSFYVVAEGKVQPRPERTNAQGTKSVLQTTGNFMFSSDSRRWPTLHQNIPGILTVKHVSGIYEHGFSLLAYLSSKNRPYGKIVIRLCFLGHFSLLDAHAQREALTFVKVKIQCYI